jgi:hypothetical protein
MQYATFICFIACQALPVLRQRTASTQHLFNLLLCKKLFQICFQARCVTRDPLAFERIHEK